MSAEHTINCGWRKGEACTCGPEPDHVDRALQRIAANYPKGTSIYDMNPKDRETVLALLSIPRRKA